MSEARSSAEGLASLAVVVVSYGSSGLLDANLRRVAAECPEAQVYVVDNFSTPLERDRAREVCRTQGWTLLDPATNLGFGGGANLGLARAFADGVEEVLLLNPDAWIGRDSVERLVARTRAERPVLVSPVVVTSAGRPWFSGLDLYLSDGVIRGRRHRDAFAGERREEWLSGACLLISRAVWELTGGFDDAYFLYWEDVDLSHRALRAGVALDVVEDAVAVHDEGGTHRGAAQRPEAKSETYYYFNIRNRLLFAARHLGDDDARRWRRASFAQARSVLLHGGRRQFLHPVAPLRAACRGLRDGRRLLSSRTPLTSRPTEPLGESNV